MPLFEEWCTCEIDQNGRKRFLKFRELDGGRATIAARLPDVMRSHYDDTARIAEDVHALGYAGAATLLAERMPRSPRARSGELGEILATELVEEQLGFSVPVRRLRYKDGREMALRGDDFIGVRTNAEDELYLLKGEAKSRANLTAATIEEARTALSRDGGRPTATSLLFIADRLMDSHGEIGELGRKIRNEVALRSVPAARIDHALFTMSGNPPPRALVMDLAGASLDRNHIVAHLHIADHQEFIRTAYEGALALGDN
ncbi:Hachiman antiphage defense system protein HamA [Burkholderia pseudomallei]|uniref:Hachiman antiphage defense system protein HamA n=1 Tax=Burkholderia pseudomallei TaxID=28450 RepID=UPI00135ED6B1|nr:DUF1837 domain-containing protein [Burkholderia pseudomallei]